MKNPIAKSIYAGFIATFALSVLMVIKAKMGMLPNMNAIKMLASMAHHFIGVPVLPVVGWVLHFLIGSVVWGILFALFYDRIPAQAAPVKGILFGTLAWILMMVMVMPVAGVGIFGLHLGIGAPIATLVLHWVYGAVLGLVYGKFASAGYIGTHTHA